MLDHCTYDKIKLLHELSSLLWFIEKYAKGDAKNANDTKCNEALDKLAQDLGKHIDQLNAILCKK